MYIYDDYTVYGDSGQWFPLLTFLQCLSGLCLSSLPLQPLTLLQTLFLDVCFIPQPCFHQPLVRPHAAVCGCDSLFWFIESQSQGREEVHVLRIISAEQKTEHMENSQRTREDTEHTKLRGLRPRDVRKRVLLPEQFGWKRLINHLLFALRASTSLAAVHDLCTLHLVIPRSWQDIMGCALSVLDHASHLETPEKKAGRGQLQR